jgi:integrase
VKTRVKFNLKRPNGTRKTFAIVKQTVREGARSTSGTVSDERIDAINRALKSGLLSLPRATLQAKDVVRDLLRRHKLETQGAAVYNSENLKVLDKYLRVVYSDRAIVDEKTLRCDLRRAAEALGSLSIVSSSKEQLQKVVDSKFEGNKQRRIVSRLNSLFAFLGRDVKLKKQPKVFTDPRHLTLDEFKRVIPCLDANLQILAWVAFGTGCRLGEIFALESISADTVTVAYQIDSNLQNRRTKNRRIRKVSVIPESVPFVEKWLRLDWSVKAQLRNMRHARALKAAARQVFRDKSQKHVGFHDLRHSHAVYLVNCGVSLSLVAQQLGSSLPVVQEHYAGYTLTDDGVQAIQSILRGTPK